jgi:hypothetical protein
VWEAAGPLLQRASIDRGYLCHVDDRVVREARRVGRNGNVARPAGSAARAKNSLRETPISLAAHLTRPNVSSGSEIGVFMTPVSMPWLYRDHRYAQYASSRPSAPRGAFRRPGHVAAACRFRLNSAAQRRSPGSYHFQVIRLWRSRTRTWDLLRITGARGWMGLRRTYGFTGKTGVCCCV